MTIETTFRLFDYAYFNVNSFFTFFLKGSSYIFCVLACFPSKNVTFSFFKFCPIIRFSFIGFWYVCSTKYKNIKCFIMASDKISFIFTMRHVDKT